MPGRFQGANRVTMNFRLPSPPKKSVDRADDPAVVSDQSNFTKRVDLAPVVRHRRTANRALDIVAAITGLILFSPTFFLVALAIKLDSRGPIFRRHTEYGCDRTGHLVLRFRFHEIPQNTGDRSGMTRVGHVLQGSGIDALPQLVSVLLGEMPIVGSSSHTIPSGEIIKGRILSFFRRPEL
jgi:putative colanic acid biosysnthesis UDP-glucose lipid carrier transferase